METAVARRAGSMRSIQSSWSLKREHILALMSKRSSIVECLKLTAITFLPLAVVIGLCTKSLLNANREIKEANAVYSSVHRSQDLGLLVSALLKERGLWCQFMAVEDNTTSAVLLVDLQAAENATDIHLTGSISILPPSMSNFARDLGAYRVMTREKTSNVSCQDVINWYSARTRKLEEECSRPFTAGAANSFWSAYFAYNALLVAQDMIGLQRALGSNYFADGNLSPRNYVSFAKNVGGAEAVLQQVTAVLFEPAAVVYSNLTSSNGELMLEINHDVDTIMNGGGSQRSEGANATVLKQNPDRYFNAVTDYMELVRTVEDFIREQMLADAIREKSSSVLEFRVVLSLVILVLIISPAFTTWYTYQSRRMMRRIADFTDQLKEQKSQLGLERQRAELLLCQMLPKTIVMEMALNKCILPESFDEATVFFSRIEDFAQFVTRSEPFQVVDMLNQLYKRCDDILDQYDAYKVETIGDSYLIVSGVPKRNRHQHSAEIATIALHFLMMMQSFQVPALPNEKFKLIVGIHTGQVVAGVMGVKQQRYCLFGDTVNIASRMMTSGVASRIHISSATNRHLQFNHTGDFLTKVRGEVKIKGKGTMNTYWLMARRGFPFTVRIEREDSMKNVYHAR